MRLIEDKQKRNQGKQPRIQWCPEPSICRASKRRKHVGLFRRYFASLNHSLLNALCRTRLFVYSPLSWIINKSLDHLKYHKPLRLKRNSLPKPTMRLMQLPHRAARRVSLEFSKPCSQCVPGLLASKYRFQ